MIRGALAIASVHVVDLVASTNLREAMASSRWGEGVRQPLAHIDWPIIVNPAASARMEIAIVGSDRHVGPP